jgi:aspartate aminotransferase-like enzyme
MSRFEPNLRLPGPTMLPPSVREAGSRQMINHRGNEFTAMLDRTLTRMRPFFGTTGDVAMLSCSGTGGLEAAVVNTVSPGQRVLCVSIGLFGDRFAEIASLYGANTKRLAVEWGQAADPGQLRAHLRSHPGYRAVFITHNETSTGVLNPIGGLAAAVREVQPEALVVVDGVSAVGAVPFEMEEWGIDVAVTASQKGWMAAPGLAMVAVSARAWNEMERSTSPRFYLDLRRYHESQAHGMAVWTPAVAVMYQLDAALELMSAEGAAAIFARHEACASATRAGLEALGFDLFGDPVHHSPTVTAVSLPEGMEWDALQQALASRGVIVAGGLGPLAGRIFRIGHLGSVSMSDVLDVVAALEEVAIPLQPELRPGAGLAAAQAAALAGSSQCRREPDAGHGTV